MSAPTLTRAETAAPRVASARRVRLLAGFLIVAGVVFGLRLVQLQAIDAEATAARAGNERLTTQVIAAPRGSITDRNGQPLAVSVDARRIVADQTLVVDPAAAAAQLAGLLDVDRAWLTDQLSGDNRYVVLTQGVSPQIWDAITALRIPGLFSEPMTAREYPAGALAGNVIGFTGADGEGLAGVESGYQELLAGTAGERSYERGADGRQIPTAFSAETPATPGKDIRLTLDRDIQWAAERAITAKVRETRAESGTVVVMDPRTGELLALATSPSVDPRDPGAAKPADRGNRAISDVFEPGSTAKLITAAAVIEEGTMTPATVLTVDDSIRRADKTFRDHTPHPVQRLTLAGIVAKSSNVGMIQSAETLSSPRVLHDYLAKFGIGAASGLDLPGESAGRLPSPEEWSGTTFPTLAFGQGMSVNTVQLAQVFATIANDGVRVAPSMVAGTVAGDGAFTAAEPARSERVVSAATAAAVRAMLEGVVSEEGTAPMAQIPGYRVAGKTGTAQRVDPDCGCYRGYTASFAGLAPADDPRLVVAVVLQDPRRGHYGGRLAGPVFRDVMSFALKTKQVPPSTGRPPVVQVFGR